MSLILVDTSAWIAFFRGDPVAVERLDSRLAGGDVGICGPVLAEVLSGAPTYAEGKRLERLLGALDWLALPLDVWRRAAEARFALARRGTQAALIDLLIALAAMEGDATLLTRDRDFERIGEVVPLRLELF
ncbi:MAG: PIN domain nuclease [Holophagales bacterium]|nr:MAG: PIN domain nuclease [Holophagales bacterium]